MGMQQSLMEKNAPGWEGSVSIHPKLVHNVVRISSFLLTGHNFKVLVCLKLPPYLKNSGSSLPDNKILHCLSQEKTNRSWNNRWV